MSFLSGLGDWLKNAAGDVEGLFGIHPQAPTQNAQPQQLAAPQTTPPPLSPSQPPQLIIKNINQAAGFNAPQLGQPQRPTNTITPPKVNLQAPNVLQQNKLTTPNPLSSQNGQIKLNIPNVPDTQNQGIGAIKAPQQGFNISSIIPGSPQFMHNATNAVDHIPIPGTNAGQGNITVGEFGQQLPSAVNQAIIQPLAGRAIHDVTSGNPLMAPVHLAADTFKAVTSPLVTIPTQAYEGITGQDNVHLPFYGNVQNFGQTVAEQGPIMALAGELPIAAGFIAPLAGAAGHIPALQTDVGTAAKGANTALGERGSIQLPGGEPVPRALESRTNPKGSFTYDDYVNQAKTEGAPEVLTKDQFENVFKNNTEPLINPVGFRPQAENTALNPEKRQIPTVNPLDYEKARSNPQLVENDIVTHGIQALSATKALSKADKAILWKAVEGTEKSTSPLMDEAISRWNDLSNTVHAWNQALGGNTNFVLRYALHNWDRSDPADAARFEQLYEERFPDDFKGVNRQHRLFNTVQEGEDKGFKLENANKPEEDMMDYIAKSAVALRQQALVKGFNEADKTALEAARKEGGKVHTFDLGNEQTIKLSDQGRKAIRTFEKLPENGRVLKSYDAINRELKAKLLSLSMFHINNVGEQMTAAGIGLPKDMVTGESHPGAISLIPKGYRAVADHMYADRQIQSALKDGTLRDGARIGYPILSGSDYTATGRISLKGGWGEGATFQRALPVMQIDQLRGILADLNRRGIDLDSAEARKVGRTAYEISGFFNRELHNLDPRVQRIVGRFLLAPQFTLSKWSVLYTAATDWGMAGNLARRAVAGKYLADVMLAAAVSMANGQSSDNLQDLFVRELIHPSIPTPWKDAKGNNLELGLPANYTSEIGGLFANLNRNQDGRLGITVNPSKVPGNVINYGRNRLSVLPSNALKIGTNENYSNRPLYDPNADLGTKATQAATTLITNSLPIGLQGIPQLDAVKSHLPQASQDVLNAQSTSGTNPLLKSVGSSFGVTPRTDTTVDKGLQSTQFFDAASQAKTGLNRQATEAIDRWLGSKKNPVTGQYDIQPNVNDTRDKAVQLLDNPDAIDHMIQMNQTLASQGQATDPLWSLPKDKIVSYLQYQAMPPGGPDQVDWRNKNSWYDQGDNSVYQQRNTFFNSLPPGDPNKPAQPIAYPQPTQAVAQAQNAYFAIYKTDPIAAAQYLQSHPEVQDQMDKQATYTNDLRQAEGYGALRTYPKPNAHVQAILDAMPKGNDPTSRAARAQAYNDPQVAAWSQADAIYNLGKGFSLVDIQGNSPTSKDLKATESLQYDIMKNPDGSLALKYGDAQGGTGKGVAITQPGAVSITGSGGSKKTPHFIKVHPKRVKPHHIKPKKVFLNKGKVLRIKQAKAVRLAKGKHPATVTIG